MISRMFKLPRHRTYNYAPRYYDADKEEREQRRKELKEQKGIESDINLKEKRISIKGNYISQKYADRKDDKIRKYVRILTIALLVIILYMLFDLVVKMY